MCGNLSTLQNKLLSIRKGSVQKRLETLKPKLRRFPKNSDLTFRQAFDTLRQVLPSDGDIEKSLKRKHVN